MRAKHETMEAEGLIVRPLIRDSFIFDLSKNEENKRRARERLFFDFLTAGEDWEVYRFRDLTFKKSDFTQILHIWISSSFPIVLWSSVIAHSHILIIVSRYSCKVLLLLRNL